MRSSEFWALVDDEFGAGYGRTLVRDHVVLALGNRTAEAAIQAGVEWREVWFALCDEMEVPSERRWGREDQPARKGRGRR